MCKRNAGNKNNGFHYPSYPTCYTLQVLMVTCLPTLQDSELNWSIVLKIQKEFLHFLTAQMSQQQYFFLQFLTSPVYYLL